MGGACYEGDGDVAIIYREGESKVPDGAGPVLCSDCRAEITENQSFAYEFWWDGRSASVEVSCRACDQILCALWEAGAECLYRGQLDDYLDGDYELLLEAANDIDLDDRLPPLNARIAQIVYENGRIARGEV